MDEDYRDGLTGAPPRDGADMGKYYMGEGEFLPPIPPAVDPPPTRSRPRPPEPPLTASDFLIVAILGAILVGLGAGVAALLLGWPYLEVALLSASVTFVIGLIVRLKVWLLGLALWLALIFGVFAPGRS
jgi:hypothetical protein